MSIDESVDESTAVQAYEKLMQVPAGKVTTYGELARAAKTTPRRIGQLMRTNPDAPRVPCHRVVMADGALGGYSAPGGVRRKAELLQGEGVAVRKNKIADLEKYFFKYLDHR